MRITVRHTTIVLRLPIYIGIGIYTHIIYRVYGIYYYIVYTINSILYLHVYVHCTLHIL